MATYTKLAVLKVIPDTTNGGAESVTIGLFNSKGIEQLQIPAIDGKLFPRDIKKGDSVQFFHQGRLEVIQGGKS